jgi:CDP-diglyceride synthetase
LPDGVENVPETQSSADGAHPEPQRLYHRGLIVTIIAVFCIVASDVGAYVFGKTFGKHQVGPEAPLIPDVKTLNSRP